MWDAVEYSRQLLELTLRHYQPLLPFFHGRRNPLSAHSAAEASRLLGFEDLAMQFAKLGPKDGSDLGLPADWRAPSLRSLAEIQADFPRLNKSYWDRCVDNTNADELLNSFHSTDSDYKRECTLLTLIVNGQISPALKLAHQLPSERKWNVRFVAAIETLRRCNNDDADLEDWDLLHGNLELGLRLRKSLPRKVVCEWAKPQMAMGIRGYAPWPGYPYPDY